MKKHLLTAAIAVFLFTFLASPVHSQVHITSSNGYMVHVTVQPVAIVPSTTSCTYGYNYNLKVNYTVTFTGSNIPSSLYTLQGNIGCGSSTHFYSLPVAGGSGQLTTGSNVWNPNPDCNTATVSSLGCNGATLSIEGPGIAAQTISFTFPSGGPLAIKLSSFTAEAVKDKVKLDWTTESEIDNDYFSIERSTDAANWTVVKTVKGAVNSSSIINYESFDENPVTGTSYYRLKQTDLNGKFTYSDTRVVKYTSGNNIYAFPVPNTGNTVNFKGILQPKDMQLLLRDATGATIYNTTLTASAVTLPVIKPGVYTLSLNNKITGEVTNLRYVKL
ncbi:hypothetical protein [Ferruginibacter sp.]